MRLTPEEQAEINKMFGVMPTADLTEKNIKLRSPIDWSPEAIDRVVKDINAAPVEGMLIDPHPSVFNPGEADLFFNLTSERDRALAAEDALRSLYIRTRNERDELIEENVRQCTACLNWGFFGLLIGASVGITGALVYAKLFM